MRRICLFILVLLTCNATALAPNELLLAVNQNSPRSLELANRYRALRGLPPENIVYLDVPDSVLAPAAEISPADFTRYIWQPLDTALRERGLLGRILAVAYSADFPVRITTAPPVSLTGLTFTRNQRPPSGAITTGTVASAFFAGPDHPGGSYSASHSLDWFRDAAPQRLPPLPAMLLAHTGARGLELDEVFQTLEKASAHVSKPWNGAFYFVTSDDLRSRMRAWQFAAAQTELAALGATALITNAPPAPNAPTLGLLSGTAWPAPPHEAFAPGAYADHCTSFGALFHTADQTKLTLWLRGGATLTSGTVSEPYSLWTKFPNARFFAHQIRGCSAIECLALSTLCPMQLLPVGDPLAAPYAPPLAARLTLRADGPRLAALLAVANLPANASPRYSFFLNGRCLARAAERPGVVFTATELPDGYYRLAGVVTAGENVRYSAHASESFLLNRHGRSPTLTGPQPNARVDGSTPWRLHLTAPAEAKEVGVFQGERQLTRGAARDLTLDPAQLGAGPVELQAGAWYADGMVVRGAPLNFEIARAVPAAEPRGFQTLELSDADFPNLGKLAGQSNRFMTCSTTNDYALWGGSVTAREIAVTLTNASLTHAARAGWAFDIRDGKNFYFFGLVGETSGWTLAQVRAGNFRVRAARGWPVRPDAAYRLGVRAGANGVECLVNREVVCRDAAVKLEAQPLGVVVSGAGAIFASPAYLPLK